MRLDIHIPFDTVFEAYPSVRKEVTEVINHTIAADFARRPLQALRFLTFQSTFGERNTEEDYQQAFSDELCDSQSISSAESSSTTSNTHFQPTSVCCCRQKSRFPKAGASTLRITTKDPAELPNCKHYVAVSYCWKNQNELPPQYAVRTSKDVRDNNAPAEILSRAILFAAYYNIRLIWIDQECIDQDDREDKEQGIQSMDLVYQHASRPLALLNGRISTQAHLIGLLRALEGEDFELNELEDAVEIMEVILGDRWLDRAWCFQETVAAGEMMQLLVSCDADLIGGEGYRHVPGEFVLSIQDLRAAAAWASSCADGNRPETWSDNLKSRANSVLDCSLAICPVAYHFERDPQFRYGCNAGAALHLLGARKNSQTEDRLAILANICNFRLRLNTHSLIEGEKKSGIQRSFSICYHILALLNGDISLLVGSKLSEERTLKALPRPMTAKTDNNTPSWMPDGQVQLQGLPFVEEYHDAVFRLKDPVICSAGLGLLGHLWRIEYAANLRVIQVRFSHQWRNNPSASDDLLQEVFYHILYKLCSDGLFNVATSLCHSICSSSAGLLNKDGTKGKKASNRDHKDFLAVANIDDIFDREDSPFRLYFPRKLQARKASPHVSCWDKIRAASSMVWIVQRVIDDGVLWYGRGETGQALGGRQRSRKSCCVFDCRGPQTILTPHSDLLVGHRRPQMAEEPMSWMCEETGRVSDLEPILVGRDLVRGVWRLNGIPPRRYILE